MSNAVRLSTAQPAGGPEQPANALWLEVVRNVSTWAAQEPALTTWLRRTILDQPGFAPALASLLAAKLATFDVSPATVEAVAMEALADDPEIVAAATADVTAHCARDPACRNRTAALLFMKGFHALQTYRVAHWLWQRERHIMAYWLQNRASDVFGVDIHPAAHLGRGIFIDHATGIVIGETAIVADDVSMLHGVTLGGSGKDIGDRHPIIGAGVLLSTGVKVLGRVRVGEGAKVGAGSVVLRDVPPHTTVVGIPARAVGRPESPMPALQMEQAVLEASAGEAAAPPDQIKPASGDDGSA